MALFSVNIDPILWIKIFFAVFSEVGLIINTPIITGKASAISKNWLLIFKQKIIDNKRQVN